MQKEGAPSVVAKSKDDKTIYQVIAEIEKRHPELKRYSEKAEKEKLSLMPKTLEQMTQDKKVKMITRKAMRGAEINEFRDRKKLGGDY